MLRRFIQSEDAQLPLRGQARGGPLGPIRVLTIGVLLLGLAACSQSSQESRVSLPVTPVISVRPRWAVAADLYIRVRADPSLDSAIRGHLRGGDVAEIVTIRVVTNDNEAGRRTWYQVEAPGLRGWAVGSSLHFYASRARALNAAGSFSADGQEASPEGAQ